MTTEQLTQARAEIWHQDGNAILTADDASAWLREAGLCLFVPRGQQLATTAPSFVEATLGASNPTPTRQAIESANELLYRVLATGDAIALNLLGAAGPGLAGEQPDFLATPETLPFLFALRGDKEWKRGPRGKSSPLSIEIWKLLGTEGALTSEEVKDKLGRQLTEAAALRTLIELWGHMRIEPLYAESEPTRWQLFETRHARQMASGSTVSQAVALSALVSLYLQSAVAASGEEIEVFLSPLASRSKVREVVKGLTATRQLATRHLGASELFHVEGSLPEFPEIARPEGAVVEDLSPAAGQQPQEMGEGRRRFVAGRAGTGSDEHKAHPAARPAAGERAPRSASADSTGDRRAFAPRREAPGGPGARKPYGTRAPGGKPGFNPREPWKEDRKPAPPREDSSDRRPFTPREDGAGERKSLAPRTGDRPFKPRGEGKPFGDRKPYTPREGGAGERKSFAPRPGDRPFKPRGEGKSFGDRKPFTPREGGAGERKSFTPREGGAGERKSLAPRTGDRPFKPRGQGKPFGDRKPYTPREGGAGERKSFAPRTGDRPFKPRGEGKSFGDRKPYTPREGGAGERKSFTPRTGDRPFKPRGQGKPFGDRKPFTPREGGAGERKSFTPRTGDRPFKPRGEGKPFGDRKPYTPREGGAGERKSFTPRTGDRPFKPRGEGKPFGDRKPYTPREGGAGERKSFTPRTGDRPFKPRGEGKPFGDRKPFPPRAGAGERTSSGPPRPSSDGPRKSFGPRKSAGPRKAIGSARPRTAGFTSSGKARTGVGRPAAGRPGPRATRGGAAGRGSARRSAPAKRTRRPGEDRGE